LYIILADN